MPHDRVERKFHPDGTLAEEIHFRGTLEHGPWRRWHPGGQLAGEWFLDLGAYMNGTNRTWYPDGTLESEFTYTNGKVTGSRHFSPTGKPLPSLADQQRAELHKFAARARRAQPRAKPPRPKPSIDHDLITILLQSPTAEALPWLRDTSSERTLGEFDRALSIELITTLHDLGSPSILVADIQDIPGCADQTSDILIITLPQDPAPRARLFALANAYTRGQGFGSTPDTCQQHLYLKLC